jgi:hypothetical protein
MWERFDIEAGYDAEVNLATFKGGEEGRVGGGVCIDDGRVG